jgi:hypothetical protein
LLGLALLCVPLGCSKLPWARKPTEEGARAPDWKLRDFQPKSPRFGQVYGLEEFRGSVLVLGLYSGLCGTCAGLASGMNELEHRWQKEGFNVRFAALNVAHGVTNQRDLTAVTDCPLFQDTEQVNAFRQQGGRQDDLFVYTPDGRLSTYFKWGGKVPFDPLSTQGQTNLRAAIVKAAR